MVRTVFIAIFALLAVFLVASPASAYSNESPSGDGKDCIDCHGTTTVEGDTSGPHGGYLTTTSKCGSCHAVHAAASTTLLPEATVKATCETCHDGTGGNGVYGAVTASGQTVESAHSVERTNVIPGGDATTGGSRSAEFSGTGGSLSCNDCHSPHGFDTVQPFTGDRARTADDVTITSARLLKRQPTSASAPVDEYGSDWCGSCHAGRLSGTSVHNHPVESRVSRPADDVYVYDRVPVVEGSRTATTTIGSLGHNNFGYVMPDPRSPLQTGRAPICMQCHEDPRSVGDQPGYQQQIDESETFSATNPRVASFPHESANAGLLVERDDDLCLNCHSPR